MSARALRVRTAVRAAFWTTALLAAYIAAHVIPEALADGIMSLFQ